MPRGPAGHGRSRPSLLAQRRDQPGQRPGGAGRHRRRRVLGHRDAGTRTRGPRRGASRGDGLRGQSDQRPDRGGRPGGGGRALSGDVPPVRAALVPQPSGCQNRPGGPAPRLRLRSTADLSTADLSTGSAGRRSGGVPPLPGVVVPLVLVGGPGHRTRRDFVSLPAEQRGAYAGDELLSRGGQPAAVQQGLRAGCAAAARQRANSRSAVPVVSRERSRRQKPVTPRYAYTPWRRPLAGRGSSRHGA